MHQISRPVSPADRAPPFPYRQLIILALCRICEPIAFMSIFPYVYFMIQHFEITDDDREIAMYAGMVTSAFAIAEFLASIFWGRLSDRVGRKPILITGLAGTGLSMLMFGLSENLGMALFARALGGLLNGNIGVLQTTVAEVVTHPDHRPRGFSIMPFVWTLGSVVGATLGGTLAEPVKNYPSLFKVGGLFDKYPFLLPNLVSFGFVVVGVVIGILFLEETHEEKKSRRDHGLELGKWIVKKSCCSTLESTDDESKVFLPHEKPGPAKPEDIECGAPSRTREIEIELPEELARHPIKAYSWRDTFNNQVLLNILALGVLAFHTIAFEQLLTVFFSMPEATTPPELPFKFTGGFALSTKDVGLILSGQGVLQMLAQLVIFPAVTKRLGPLRTFRLVIFGYPVLYLLLPYMSLVPHHLRFVAIFAVLTCKVTGQAFSYPSNNLMLVDHAPSPRVLGTLNGISSAAASLARAFGPTLGGSLQALGLRLGYVGLAWWACSLVAVCGAAISMYQRHEPIRPLLPPVSEILADDESELTAPILAAFLETESQEGDSDESSHG